MSTSLCGKICITPPKSIRKERRRDFYSRCSIVAAAGAMNATSRLSEPTSIKLCRQPVVSHHAFDQRSRWRATAFDCTIRHSRLAVARFFLAHVSMTSEQVGHNLDTFLPSMHLAVIGSAQILLISNKPVCVSPAHRFYITFCLVPPTDSTSLGLAPPTDSTCSIYESGVHAGLHRNQTIKML